MSNQNVDLIHAAYDALARGDLETMLSFVDEDLVWTYLDRNDEDARPQVCHGRHQLESTLLHWAEHGFRASLEEIEGRGERIMVCVRVPGDRRTLRRARRRSGLQRAHRARRRIVALHDCRNRPEAMSVADSVSPEI